MTQAQTSMESKSRWTTQSQAKTSNVENNPTFGVSEVTLEVCRPFKEEQQEKQARSLVQRAKRSNLTLWIVLLEGDSEHPTAALRKRVQCLQICWTQKRLKEEATPRPLQGTKWATPMPIVLYFSAVGSWIELLDIMDDVQPVTFALLTATSVTKGTDSRTSKDSMQTPVWGMSQMTMYLVKSTSIMLLSWQRWSKRRLVNSRRTPKIQRRI